MSSDKNLEENVAHKHIRKRKKHLYKQLRSQMEFYFSDANIQKDRFLNKQIKEAEDGYIDLEIFLKFNKIRCLTDDIRDLSAATKKSSFLQLDDNKKKIRRVSAFIEPANVDERTVYIEPLPTGTTIESIQAYFSSCGKIEYVSLPRYKSTRDIKGFAFVEFATIESAQLACQTLNSLANDKVGIFPKASKKCKELEKQLQKNQNCTSNESDATSFKNDEDVENNTTLESNIKKDITDINNSNINSSGDLIELDDSNKIKSKARKRKISCDSEKDSNIEWPLKNSRIEKDDNKVDTFLDQDLNNDKKKKLKKKKKTSTSQLAKEQDSNLSVKKQSKLKSKNKNKLMADLKVIPKSEWLKLRSEYILKQKSNWKMLKEKLKQLKEISLKNVENQSTYGSHKINVTEMQLAPNSQNEETKSHENTNSNAKELNYVENVVLKFESKHEHSKKDIKLMLESKYQIAYVDFNVGDKIGYVRCLDAETAANLSNDSKFDGLTFYLLKGEEELKYWDKINADRNVKYTTRVKKVKKGKDKLKNRADKYLQSLTNKQHIVYD